MGQAPGKRLQFKSSKIRQFHFGVDTARRRVDPIDGFYLESEDSPRFEVSQVSSQNRKA